MTRVIYDGSFGGLLTAIFEVFEYKLVDASLSGSESTELSLFGNTHTVVTSEEKVKRVLVALEKKISGMAIRRIYESFLSEAKGIDDCLLRYIRYIFNSVRPVENNYGNADVLQIQQLSRKVQREKHRMEAFVRFELTKDGLYYSLVQPDYNVLPLIARHFKDRYADQRWLIYDARRKYGIYYDLETVTDVQLAFEEGRQSLTGDRSSWIDESEELVQQLWRQYFTSVNIVERKNMKLHIRHMPKRYWRYLTEKNGRAL